MTKTITRTKKQHNKEIEAIYFSLVRIMEGNGYLDLFIQEVIRGEKQYRKQRPSSIKLPFGLTVNAAAMYFVCRFILAGKTSKLKAKDYLHTRKEVFTGYAIYQMYKDRIKSAKVFNKKAIESIESFDYAEYI